MTMGIMNGCLRYMEWMSWRGNIRAMVVRLFHTGLALLIGMIILLLGDFGLELAKSKVDAYDIALVSDALVIIPILMMSTASSSAVGRILGLSGVWTAGACPLLLSLFAIICAYRWGLLISSLESLNSILSLKWTGERIVSACLVILAALTTGGLATQPGSNSRRISVLTYTVLLLVVLSCSLLVIAYCQMVAEVRVRTEVFRRYQEAPKPLRSQFFTPRKGGRPESHDPSPCDN